MNGNAHVRFCSRVEVATPRLRQRGQVDDMGKGEGCEKLESCLRSKESRSVRRGAVGKGPQGTSLAAYPTARPVLNGRDEETCPQGKCALSLPNPWSDGTTGIRLTPLELLEKLAALVPLPHSHLVRYGGCLAPHSHLRGAIIPTPRQQGLDELKACPTSPRWSWTSYHLSTPVWRFFYLSIHTFCPPCIRFES
jgi:hypothetical protein